MCKYCEDNTELVGGWAAGDRTYIATFIEGNHLVMREFFDYDEMASGGDENENGNTNTGGNTNDNTNMGGNTNTGDNTNTDSNTNTGTNTNTGGNTGNENENAGDDFNANGNTSDNSNTVGDGNSNGTSTARATTTRRLPRMRMPLIAPTMTVLTFPIEICLARPAGYQIRLVTAMQPTTLRSQARAMPLSSA